MKHIVECSSLYDIDFTAVLYDYICCGQEDFSIFLNCSAVVDTNYRREHIARLAIPILLWEKDAQNQLRQLHVPIDSIEDRNSFLDTIHKCLDMYLQYGCNKDELIKLYNDIEFYSRPCNTGLECYMALIELLIYQVCGIKVKVEDFSPIRKDGSDYTNAFISKMIQEMSLLQSGKYRFCKGGRIELLDQLQWKKLNTFYVSDDDVVFYDENDCSITSEHICDSQTKVRLRGPLETVALRQTGSLIDLPWYLDADFSVGSAEDIEFISPISVSSQTRVSSMSGGNGNRLFPCGYSLIEYYTPNVEKVLKYLLDEKGPICVDDLDDWIRIVNNYPITNQKISKSFSSIKLYCDTLLQSKFADITENKANIKKMQGYNFVTMGTVLVDMCIILKFFRLTSNKKSRYYNYSDNSKLYYNKKNLEEFYTDTISLLDKCRVLFSRYFNTGEDIDDYIRIMDGGKSIWKTSVSDSYIDDDIFYRLVSKLEKSANSIIREYYSIALFVSGVLLKANIFSAFCVIGNGESLKNKIKDVLAIRQDKYLKYKPIWYERIDLQ